MQSGLQLAFLVLIVGADLGFQQIQANLLFLPLPRYGWLRAERLTGNEQS